jgi:hypothetical protein
MSPGLAAKRFCRAAVRLVVNGFKMTNFVAFKLTSEGRVIEAMEMYCSEDEAKERARELAKGAAVELWEGWHRIARYGARD